VQGVQDERRQESEKQTDGHQRVLAGTGGEHLLG
jgi:hypothetical protein